jgi:tryptophan halogenase
MIKNIVIVGGGFAGWYTAASVKHNSPDTNITVIDTDKVARLSVGETLGWSSPYDWKNNLGLEDDRMLMWETGATYKYGIHVNDFWDNDKNFSYGKFFNLKVSSLSKFYSGFDYPDYHEPWNESIDDIGVQEAWMTINKDSSKNFSDYTNEINDTGYFASSPSAPYNKNNQYILRNQEGWSYHIDAEQSVRFIRDLAYQRNVVHISSAVVDIRYNNDGIQSLLLDDGNTITADMFIDCSGFHRVLSKNNPTWVAAGSEYCNSAWVCPAKYLNPEQEMHGGTDIFGEDYGWRFRIGLYHRHGNGYVFNSNIVNEEVPLAKLSALTVGSRIADPRLIKWQPGWYSEPWHKNVISIGIAANFVDPYDAPTFELHNWALKTLFELLNSNRSMDELSTEYNRQQSINAEERMTRLWFNFGLSKRTGEFWDSRRQMLVEKNLTEKIYDLLNDGSHFSTRLKHFWKQMYYRMIMATDTDRTKLNLKTMSITDTKMAKAFFDYTRARNEYIKTQKWPNYYEWLKENRFNGQTHNEVYERLSQ